MATPPKAEPTERTAPGLEPGYVARIKYALGTESPNAFAKRAGLTRSYLYAVLKGEKMPSLAFMSSVEDTTGIVLQWLVSGRGMPTEAWNEKTVLIPCLEVGSDASLADGGRVMLVELESLKGIPPDKVAAVSAPDAGMAPLIQRGDRLVVELDPAGIAEKGIYLLKRNSLLTSRRLTKTADGWMAVPGDPDAPDDTAFVLDEERDKIVARICSALKVFL